MGKIIKKKIKILRLNTSENLYKITQNLKLLKSIREIYVSEIKPYSKKAWKFSNNINQNIFILNSKVKIYYKDGNIKKKKSITLSNKNLNLVTIPKKTNYCFVNIENKKGYIINLINKKYNLKKK